MFSVFHGNAISDLRNLDRYYVVYTLHVHVTIFRCHLDSGWKYWTAESHDLSAEVSIPWPWSCFFHLNNTVISNLVRMPIHKTDNVSIGKKIRNVDHILMRSGYYREWHDLTLHTSTNIIGPRIIFIYLHKQNSFRFTFRFLLINNSFRSYK